MRASGSRPILRAILVSAPLLGGCGGASNPTADASALMSETTAGQHRCVTAGDEHKLFAIEWDATDASTFQARADRDIVFVHYEGCEMRVVDGCSDGSLAGAYGTYRKPVFTSGSSESFTVRTQDELAAKLPLGVVTLGGELKNDRALELSYHVSGTALATRDEIYTSDFAGNPRCADVTHAVVAYNLGAFVLGTQQATKVGASAEVEAFSAEGSHRGEKGTLRTAGDMSACAKVDNHACRIPIRVTLRPVRPGARPHAGGRATPSVLLNGQVPPGLMESMTAVGIEGQAQQKFQMHDGVGCLADLDKADRTDPQGKERRLDLRARCEMRAGRCEEGKAHYAEARRIWYRQNDKAGLANDATITHEVEKVALAECATKQGGGKSVQNAGIDLLQKIMIASVQKDAEACLKHGRALKAQINAKTSDSRADHMAWAGLSKAAMCAAEGGKCAEAKPLYLESVERMSPGMTPAFLESAWEQNVPSCKGKP